MAALIGVPRSSLDMLLGAAPLNNSHPHAKQAEGRWGEGTPVRRPPSPPQPVPRPRTGAQHRPQQEQEESVDWEDASMLMSTSPTSSDATDAFFDSISEQVSTGTSYDAESMEELLAKALPRLSVPETLAAAAAAVASSGCAQQQPQLAPGLLQRERRLLGEVEELRRQLSDISSLLFAWRQEQPGSGGTAVPAPPPGFTVAQEVGGVLQAAAAQCRRAEHEAAAARRGAAEVAAAAAGSAADAAFVARLVSGICARAATAADLSEQWDTERTLLERRLAQAARMGQAMLKHQKEHSTELEPWRQQLLNTLVSVGCSILGAAAAVLLIHSYSAPPRPSI